MPSSALRDAVRDYLVADRQWARHLRIAYARLMLSQVRSESPTNIARLFWREVLKANGARS